MLPAATLLLVVVAAYFGPEHIADLLGWRWAAASYVMQGAEACGLWLFAALVALRSRRYALCAVPCVLASVEAAMRAGCRLALPMTSPPKLAQGQTICDAAFGVHMTWLSILCAALAAAYVAGGGRARPGR